MPTDRFNHLLPLRAVCGIQLSASSFQMPTRALDQALWDHLASSASSRRGWGLVCAAIEDGSLPTTRTQHEEAERKSRIECARQVRLDAALVALARSFDDRGVDYRLLKGPAAAAAFYREPRARHHVDIDILARPAELAATVRVLTDVGASRPRLGPDANAWGDTIGWGQPLQLPSGIEVDIHQTLRPGPFGLRIDIEDLFAHRTELTIGGVAIPTMDDDLLFIHACYHAVLHGGPPALVPLLDVASALDRGVPDAARVVAVAEGWRGGAVVARAVRAATEMFALDTVHPLQRFARDRTDRPMERQWLATYYSTDPRNHLLRPLVLLEAQRGWPDRLRMLKKILVHEGSDPPLVRARRVAVSAMNRRA